MRSFAHEKTTDSGGCQATALDARFPGQWFQIESALHYNWHRHYDPTLGRYTQPDPLGFVDGPSVYGYAKARPQQLVDPDGRQVALPIPLPAICAANPLACGAVVAGAGAYMCYKAISGSSGPKKQRDYCQEQLDDDNACCASLGVRQHAAICGSQAMLRYGNCLAKRDIPPLGYCRR